MKEEKNNNIPLNELQDVNGGKKKPIGGKTRQCVSCGWLGTVTYYDHGDPSACPNCGSINWCEYIPREPW